jgi:hypothetical protein
MPVIFPSLITGSPEISRSSIMAAISRMLVSGFTVIGSGAIRILTGIRSIGRRRQIGSVCLSR